MKRHVQRVNYFLSEHKPLFIPIGLCFMKRYVWRVSYFFIKRLTKIETSSTFLNNHQKILQKILENSDFRSFTQKIPELELSLYETIFSKLNYHYYNLSLYIPIYTVGKRTRAGSDNLMVANMQPNGVDAHRFFFPYVLAAVL